MSICCCLLGLSLQNLCGYSGEHCGQYSSLFGIVAIKIYIHLIVNQLTWKKIPLRYIKNIWNMFELPMDNHAINYLVNWRPLLYYIIHFLARWPIKYMLIVSAIFQLLTLIIALQTKIHIPTLVKFSIKNCCAAFWHLMSLQTLGSVTPTWLPGSNFTYLPAP